MKRSVILSIAAVFSATALAITACARSGAAAPEGELIVRRGEFVDRVLLTGELEAAKADVLTVPRLPSWQTSVQWIAESGIEVKAGEKVVELDNSEFTKTLRERQEARIQTLQTLEQKRAEAIADIAQKEFDAQRFRLELDKARIAAEVPPEIVSAREHQDRLLALEKAERQLRKGQKDLEAARAAASADLRNLEIELEGADRDIEVAERAVEDLVLRAPGAGLFLIENHPWEGRPLQQGDTVFVGFPLAQIPDLSTLRVTASLFDVDDGAVAPGMPAVVSADAWPGLEFTARIIEVAPVAQEERGSSSLRRGFRVVAELDGKDPERMKPGYSVRLEVIRARQAERLLVPRAAVDVSAGPPRVRLFGGRVAEVTLGPCNALECVVEGGLSEGDRVQSIQILAEAG